MMYPRTLVLARRMEVTSLMVRGVPPGEIADILNLPRATVYNDVRAIRSGRSEALAAHSRTEIVAQLHLNLQARTRALWAIHDSAASPSVKLRALSELRLNDERLLNRLPGIPTARERAEQRASLAELSQIIDSLTATTHAAPRPQAPAPAPAAEPEPAQPASPPRARRRHGAAAPPVPEPQTDVFDRFVESDVPGAQELFAGALRGLPRAWRKRHAR